MNRTQSISWSLMSLSAFMIGLYALAFFLIPEMGDPLFKIHFSTIPTTAYAHIIPGGIALIIGAYQFHPGIRKRWINLHRYAGRVYLTAVIVGAIGGILLAWYAPRDPATRLGFASLGVIWLYTAVLAYIAVRKGDIKAHQQWMIRSYALTLAAVTLRIQLGIYQGALGLSFDQSYAIVAWFAWVPNLIIAEWLFIQRPLKKSV